MNDPVANTVASTVAIIGAGQAGAALGWGLRRAGADIVAVASRSPESAERLARQLGAQAVTSLEALEQATLVLLAMPDNEVAGVVVSLAATAAFRPDHQVLHCSGVLPLDVLAPASMAGASVGVLHPVTPLVPPDDPATLDGKLMGCEAAGDDAWVLQLAEQLGGRPVRLAGVDRTLYHAAAATASNLVVAICGMAENLFREAGIDVDDARALVASLVSATARNIERSGPAGALTGPVRRGDATVIRRHLEALAHLDPMVAETYRLVSLRILDLMGPSASREASAAALVPDLVPDPESGGKYERRVAPP